MNWEDTDENTVMHMMGYGENIWQLPIFKEAVQEYRCDIYTLLCLVNNYIRLWGLNSDIESIRNYLESLVRIEQEIDRSLGVD